MQQNFTLKKIGNLVKAAVLVLCLSLPALVKAQTISTASGTNYNGDYSINNAGSLVQTFVIQNTNATAVVLSDISMQMAPYFTAVAGAPSAITLLYSATSLSGPVTGISAPDWLQIASFNTTVPAALTVIPVIQNANFTIPANTQYRFAVVATKGMAFSFVPTPTPNSFTTAGIVLKVGNSQIAGQNVGYAGVFPDLPAANTPSFFGGSVTFVAPQPCTGTPAPGNTLSTTPSACPGVNFTLSYQNQPPAGTTGLTYQWQSASAVGGPYTNIPGAVGSTLTTSQNASTFYRVIVNCGANTGTSTAIQVLLTPPSGCYCIPTYTNGCALGDFISNVTVGTLNNTSACSNPPYTYYSAVAAPTLIVGGTYPARVTVGPDTFGQNVAIWIDFNMDGDFSDPGEYIGGSGNVGPNGIATININVPVNATLGTTRMRVRGGDDVAGLATQSCGASNSTFGEAEDYNVTIAPCVQGVYTAQPANITVPCSGNANFTITATGSALVYGWEYRVNATSPWLNVTNSGPYSNATTPSLTISNVTSAMNGYQYRALISGPCTAIDHSSVATLSVGPLVATTNVPSATICTGQVQALTLTNAASPTTTVFNSAALTAQIPDLVGPPASSAAVCNAGINNNIAVSLPVGSVITRMDVKLNITHSYVGDLIIVLKAPNGQVLNLDYHKSGTGTLGANFVNTVFSSAGVNPVSSGVAPGYTGLWRADASTGAGSFADITGSGPTGFAPTTASWNALWSGTINGNWTIAMCDPQEWAGDIGTLTSWSIEVTYGAPAAGVWTAAPATPNTMFTNAGATVPYIAGSQANTIYVNPTVTTTYSVIYATATPCLSAPTNVTVNVVNPVGAVTQPVNKAACVGSDAVFTVSAAGGPNTYQWQVSTDGGVTWTNVPGATSSTLTVPAVTSAMNTSRYRAVITAAPCAGSVNSNAAILTVNPLPTVTLSSPDLSITPGQSTTLTASSNPAAAANGFVWTLDGNTIAGTGNTQNVRIDGLGAYRARVTDINGCVNISSPITVTGEASDRLWIYPNPNQGMFQVRLFYGGNVTERRVVSIFSDKGELVMQREFTLTNASSPYVRMDFDGSKLASGTYVVKVDNRNTGNIVSGLVVINH